MFNTVFYAINNDAIHGIMFASPGYWNIKLFTLKGSKCCHVQPCKYGSYTRIYIA